MPPASPARSMWRHVCCQFIPFNVTSCLLSVQPVQCDVRSAVSPSRSVWRHVSCRSIPFSVTSSLLSVHPVQCDVRSPVSPSRSVWRHVSCQSSSLMHTLCTIVRCLLTAVVVNSSHVSMTTAYDVKVLETDVCACMGRGGGGSLLVLCVSGLCVRKFAQAYFSFRVCSLMCVFGRASLCSYSPVRLFCCT